MPNGVIAHDADGQVRPRRADRPRPRPGRASTGMDLGQDVSRRPALQLGRDALGLGRGLRPPGRRRVHVVAVDYGVKRNILRCLAAAGCKVTVVPAHAPAPRTSWRASPTACSCPTARAIRPRPATTRCPRSRSWSTAGKPVFGICLGHQMLALALGGQDRQDASGPPRRQPSGQGPHHRQGRDHLDEPRLRRRPRHACPTGSMETHVSLFDGSNCGIALKDRPVFSRAAPPRGLARPAGQPLSVRTLHRGDGEREEIAGSRVAALSCLPSQVLTEPDRASSTMRTRRALIAGEPSTTKLHRSRE